MFNSPLTEAEQATLDWMDDVCKQAVTESRSGNLALINSLGKHNALSCYINNVVSRNVLSRDQFAYQYRGSLLKEAMLVRDEYLGREQMQESVARVSKVEEGLAELKKLVEGLVPQIAALAEAKKPAKKSGKTEDAEDSAEGE